MVLLKNEDDVLPLSKGKIKSVAILGPNAYPAAVVGGGSAQVEPFAALSFMEGLSQYLSGSADVFYRAGIPSLKDLAETTEFNLTPIGGERGIRLELFDNMDLSGKPVITRTDPRINLTEDLGREISKSVYFLF